MSIVEVVKWISFARNRTEQSVRERKRGGGGNGKKREKGETNHFIMLIS